MTEIIQSEEGVLQAREAAMNFIDNIESAMQSLNNPVDCPLIHRFSPGLYIREIFMPAGTWLTSKIHKTEHPFVILSGIVSTWTKEEGAIIMMAGTIRITKPDTRRVLFALVDTKWATFHPTDEVDLKKIEEDIIFKHDSLGINQEVLA